MRGAQQLSGYGRRLLWPDASGCSSWVFSPTRNRFTRTIFAAICSHPRINLDAQERTEAVRDSSSRVRPDHLSARCNRGHLRSAVALKCPIGRVNRLGEFGDLLV